MLEYNCNLNLLYVVLPVDSIYFGRLVYHHFYQLSDTSRENTISTDNIRAKIYVHTVWTVRFWSTIWVTCATPMVGNCFKSAIKETQEEFEDTKGVIRIRNSEKNRQHNDQKKKDNRTKNYLQNIHIKLKIE